MTENASNSFSRKNEKKMLVFPKNAEKKCKHNRERPTHSFEQLGPGSAYASPCQCGLPRGDLPIDLCGCNRALVHRFIMADDVNNVEKFSEKFTGLLFILNACLT